MKSSFVATLVLVLVVTICGCFCSSVAATTFPDTVFYGFTKTSDGAIGVSSYDLLTGAFTSLPNPAEQAHVLFDEQQTLSSCLDLYRQYIYTVGVVGGSPYLAGYAINSGEAITLTSLSDYDPVSISGCGIDSNNDSVWLLNTNGGTNIISINPFLNTSTTVYSNSNFNALWGSFDATAGVAYVIAKVGSSNQVALLSVQLSSGAATQVTLNTTSDSIPYSFVWVPSFEKIFSYGVVQYNGNSVLEVLEIDIYSGDAYFLNLLRYANVPPTYSSASITWDQHYGVLYLADHPSFGVSPTVGAVVFGVNDSRFPSLYQVFQP